MTVHSFFESLMCVTYINSVTYEAFYFVDYTLYLNLSSGINATKALAHVLGKKGMDIKSCYIPKDKSHITRYQELQHYKQTRKGVLLDYS